MYFSSDSNLGMLATTATQRLVAMEQQLCQTLQQQLTAIHTLQQQEWMLSPFPRAQSSLMIKAYKLSAQILGMQAELIAQATQSPDSKTRAMVDTLGQHCEQIQTVLTTQQRDNQLLLRLMPTTAALPPKLQEVQQQQLKWLEEQQAIVLLPINVSTLALQLQQVRQSLIYLTHLLQRLSQPAAITPLQQSSPVKSHQSHVLCVACYRTTTNGRCACCSHARA
ncbi:MAG: hypothetical protein K5Q00_04325 [Gammaproteobacteria bacterium]|nr:hypothetical protein [Gammaproteobacteria bacterium]